MSLSQSFRHQAREAENLARRTTFGPQRVFLSQEAKTLYQAADEAERQEAASPAARRLDSHP